MTESAPDISSHTCHARNCAVPCKPEYLMCNRHWAMVPMSIRRKVWKHYRPGQCDDKNPSELWIEAANAAIRAVALSESNREKARSHNPNPATLDTDPFADPFAGL